MLLQRLLLACVLIACTKAGTSQDATQPPANADRQMRLKAAEGHARQVDLRLANAEKAVELIARPLLIYGDSARNNSDGTLWAWGAGRPLAFLETYRSTQGTAPRASVLTLTSGTLVTAKVPGGRLWNPQAAQIKPEPVPAAPPPADKPAARLRQLKELARRFTGHEFWDPDNSRFELRLLVQPVHRYADESEKIVDGAAFVLAHGTNPEVLLLLEALGPADSAKWHYSIARVGSAELHVEFDGKEVWKQGRTPGIVGQPTDPYWLFMTAGEPAEPNDP